VSGYLFKAVEGDGKVTGLKSVKENIVNCSVMCEKINPLYIKLSKYLAVNFTPYLTYYSYPFTVLTAIFAARSVARQLHNI